MDFLQYEYVSNDAFSKSDITAAVFDENLRLRQDKERLLEQFRQQIHVCSNVLLVFLFRKLNVKRRQCVFA